MARKPETSGSAWPDLPTMATGGSSGGPDAAAQAKTSSHSWGGLPPETPPMLVALPHRATPWRVLFVDDTDSFLIALHKSSDRQSIDLRTWLPKVDFSLKALLESYAAEETPWRPDVLVLDVNLSKGGFKSLELLRLLREENRYQALPIVLATGHRLVEADAEELRKGSGASSPDWQREAREAGAEGVMWSKTPDAAMLLRLMENLDHWRALARRRAWAVLIAQVAQLVREPKPGLTNVATAIAEFCADAFYPASVFVRWRNPNGTYRLAAHKEPQGSPAGNGALRPNIALEEVPILMRLFSHEAPALVLNEGISQQDAGNQTHLKDMLFLGVGVHLGTRTYGFVTLTLPKGAPPFDAEIDPPQLILLAQLLATSIGRVETLESVNDRQKDLLAFSSRAAEATTRTEVCEAMAAMLHRALHRLPFTEHVTSEPNGENAPPPADDSNGKVTCRLLDFSTGLLESKAAQGYANPVDKSRPINFVVAKSFYAEVVRTGKSLRANDVKDAEQWGRLYQDNHGGKTNSELCVAIKIGQQPIGALNLENTALHYYTQLDEEFVEHAAQTLGQVIAQLTAQRFERGALEFVTTFTRGAKADKLDKALRDVLHRLCGYSVLIDVVPSDDQNAWQARSVDQRLRLEGTLSDAELLTRINENLASTWATQGTLLSRQLAHQAWQQGRAYFTDDAGDFLPIDLANGVQQRADAVIWICKDSESPPYRALLMLWGLPPPIDQAQVSLMDQLARLFAGVDAFRGRVESLIEERALGQQYEALGHVMQHFRHRLTNDTTILHGNLDLLNKALDKQNWAMAQEAASELGLAIVKIDESYQASHRYVKAVALTSVSLFEIANAAASELAKRLAKVEWRNEVPLVAVVQTDPVVASMVVFSLMENALDALKGQAGGCIVLRASLGGDQLWALRVEDNGPGVPLDWQPNLFKAGYTTKAEGLGSALAFARVRARLLGAERGGDLVFDASHHPGAAFALALPAHGSEPQDFLPAIP